MSQGLHTTAVFFDIAGAFDTVPHDKLLITFENANYPPTLCKILRSYFTGSSHKILVQPDNTHSTGSARNAARRSPIAVLMECLHKHPPTIRLAISRTPHPGVRRRRGHLVRLYNGGRTCGAITTRHPTPRTMGTADANALSTSKTQVMAFRYRGRLLQLALTIYEERLEQVACVRYLGVTVDARHIWLPHLRRLIPRVNTLAYRFLPTVRALRPVPRVIARKLYTMATLPVITYGTRHLGIHLSQTRACETLRTSSAPVFAINHAHSSHNCHQLATPITGTSRTYSALATLILSGLLPQLRLFAIPSSLHGPYTLKRNRHRSKAAHYAATSTDFSTNTNSPYSTLPTPPHSRTTLSIHLH